MFDAPIIAQALQQLAERYCVLRELGEGGQGKVVLVFDKDLQREACLKLSWSSAPLATEARLLRELGHALFPPPKALWALKVCQSDDRDRVLWVLERPFLEGMTLQACLDYVFLGQVVPKETVVSWGIQLCQLLEVLHCWSRGPIIFRDLKPDNILLDNKGHLHLIDFGAAAVGCATAAPLVGTVPYLAPEYIDHGVLTPETDVYALGVILYQALGGTLPVNCYKPESHGPRCLCAASDFHRRPLEQAGDLGVCIWSLLANGRPATAQEARARLGTLLD